MNKILFVTILLTLTFIPGYGQKKNPGKKYPIIDMHLHAEWWGQPEIVESMTKLKSYKDQKTLTDTTFRYLKKYNIVKAVTDGNLALEYFKHEPEQIIPARRGYTESIDSLRKWFKNGTYKVMAEFMPQYDGVIQMMTK